MTAAARPTIGLTDVVRNLPGIAPELPAMAANTLGLIRGPESRHSVGLAFQRAARRHPHRPFLIFEGRTIGYREANRTVNRYAHALTDAGVRRGDVVGVLMKNRPETVYLVLAICKLGATAGMLNHNQRGPVLSHSIDLLGARLLVVGAECREVLDSVGADVPLPEELKADDLLRAARDAETTDPPVCAEVTGRERAFLVFTSGTTGLPKASVMTHYRWSAAMTGIGGFGVRLRRTDRLYCCLPLYHNNALTIALSAVIGSGASLALGRQFSVRRFWSEIAAADATAFVYIGELCRYLLNQPPRPDDRDHRVRLVVGNGLRPEIWEQFRTRFGIPRVVEFYGASEGNIVFVNAIGLDRTAGISPLPHAVVEFDDATGRPRRGPDGRLLRVDRGAVGLLLAKVTPRTPFDGYTDPEATEAKLVRDGFTDGDAWLNTGDLVRRQGMLHIAFVDRLGDTYRWKGENVATTEVEGVIAEDPAVEQVAVYGVPVPDTDGRAGMAAVLTREAMLLDPTRLAGLLYRRLPGYAVPLFVRVVAELEQTATFKNRKVELRAQGYREVGADPLYVLAGATEGYVEATPDSLETYLGEVAAGKRPAR
ncbi:long-chain-acyl-CoA synthetase [Skermania piniformis]|uniref:Long-chain-acyl-CoA synthetase n=1 Tax=Skermania pinensis TaxID=39122 RepID=A0ABX8S805_9ACTN|nr:long-chain-acyl-CoA synthetase [Skermania piniformis]QXQ13144.1 long-chain-acyl-CoA synthetase [Skermania piniformis]